MDMKSFHADGDNNLSAGQQAAFYYARKRRRAREGASPAEFKSQDPVGFVLVVVLSTE